MEYLWGALEIAFGKKTFSIDRQPTKIKNKKMNYKSIIRSRQLRFKILQLLDWVPDFIMLRIQYRIKMGGWPDFNHPKRFTEKLQLYKMKYRNPVMSQCVDKYEVRKYVESKGLGHILNEIYGVCNSPEEIDFDSLPDRFVIKSTTGGGGLNVIVVKDKAKCDYNEIKRVAASWGSHKVGTISPGREWAYSGVGHSRIIIEQYLEDSTQVGGGDLSDYKFFCFNGIPKCVQVDTGRFDGHRQNYYDMQWHSLGVHCTYPEGEDVVKPVNFEEMNILAAQLSEDFPFVRVDLYNVDGKVYFGEMTFYPSSGYGKFYPESFDFVLGKEFGYYWTK